ncbi:T9SS type A sorting domain-containing protein [Neolewinella aurantiaca]|uniref:T9SS type A sorting domain-containing protein n=1 Tax=Neolewinella aurantiaca TaxID=2602767 RepID=A0A5C7FMY7_9BACT|nr:M4 family metallopeptidase [Neolewinella aurantiaca]TXF91512.1 T9SS type A sorting domain-containing protein [Neolewinella aurantiaca]
MKHIFFLLLLLCGGSTFAQPESKVANARKALVAANAVWQSETPRYASLRFENPLALPAADRAAAADLFLDTYGPAFNLTDTLQPRLLRETKGVDGRFYRRYQVVRNEVPVLGAEFTVELSAGGAIRGFSGTLPSSTFLAPAAAPIGHSTPVNFSDFARATLLAEHPQAMQWTVHEENAAWTRQNPWKNQPRDAFRLTRAFRVSEPAGSHEEMVYLDAGSGRLVFRHTLTCSLNRSLFHRNTASYNIVWQEGDPFPGSLNDEDQEMLLATAETYNLFARTFSRNSYDDENGKMQGVTNALLFNCPNASAGGDVVRHCTGVVADDVVAHEWSHNYTNSMNGLLYAYESGAINEAIADIFGECVDLLNGRDNDAGTHLARTGCNDGSSRWLIGEDITAVDTALRDLWLPECKNDPSDKESDNYSCEGATEDYGGVHTNSGLVNRAFTLLTDGGILNGDTIRAIGMTRALHLFQHANANYVTRVTDFFAFGDMLIRSAEDLIDVPLPELTLLDLPAMTSPDVFTRDEVREVIKAVRATQLQEERPCIELPTLLQNPPEPCAIAIGGYFSAVFHEGWERGLAAWDTTERPTNAATWDPKPWRTTVSLPDGRPGAGAFAPNPRAGNCRDDFDNGRADLTSPVISLPVEETEFVLTFDHYYAIQKDYDGGFLFMSRNGGGFLLIQNQHFLYNGYDGQLQSIINNDNPLAGRRAFNGADLNSTSGTWGQSIVDLTAAGAEPGDDIRLRWTMSHDGCDGWLGWFLDDVHVGFCGLTALPVDLLHFTARGGKDRVDLSWATTEEQNNAGFYVERRAEGETGFRELGFVAQGQEYTFADQEVLPGKTYVYRLRQTDTDGSYTCSRLVSARTQDAEKGLSAWPNPVRNVLYVRAGTTAETASLYDVKGRVVRKIALNNGFAEVDVITLKQGVYFLRVGDLVDKIIR